VSDIHQLLEQYGESHRNPVNKAIHWVAVPLIVWTVVALLWSIPAPTASRVAGVPLNWAVLALALAQVYWFRLSPALGLGLLAWNLAMIALTLWAGSASPWPLWQLAIAIFVLSWLFQFIGHAIEGRRPSFLQDIQFLLIGPAWLLAFVYRAVGLRY